MKDRKIKLFNDIDYVLEDRNKQAKFIMHKYKEELEEFTFKTITSLDCCYKGARNDINKLIEEYEKIEEIEANLLTDFVMGLMPKDK